MIKQIAKLNYLREAPRKVRLIADLVKGMTVNEAEAQLVLNRQRAAKTMLKLLRSAVANAKATKKVTADKLIVESVRVDGGPMLKRYLPRARGSASPIQKKMSHVTLVLAETEAKTHRFNITVVKKQKTSAEDKKEARKKKGEEGAEKPAKEGNPGFLKRRFSRKAI